MRRLLVLPLLLALVACGDKVALTPRSDGSTSPPPPHSYAADGVVLRVTHEGGYVPQDHAPNLPYFAVYGDGRVMTLGPVRDVYPGSAMPNVQVAKVDAATVDWFAAEARKAGVDGEERDYGDPPIADVFDTVFHLSDAKGTVDLRVYALREAGGTTGLSAEQRANRDRLIALSRMLTDPAAWPGAHVDQGRYEPTTVAVYAKPYDLTADPQVTVDEIAWKGPDPAAGAKHRAGLCTLVTGDALAATIADLRRATTIARWTYGGKAYRFTVRPLLPHEQGCLA